MNAKLRKLLKEWCTQEEIHLFDYQLKDLQQRIEAAGLLNEWVSMEERQPAEGAEVLIVMPCGKWYVMQVCTFENGLFIGPEHRRYDRVTYWQAIAPPKE